MKNIKKKKQDFRRQYFLYFALLHCMILKNFNIIRFFLNMYYEYNFIITNHQSIKFKMAANFLLAVTNNNIWTKQISEKNIIKDLLNILLFLNISMQGRLGIVYTILKYLLNFQKQNINRNSVFPDTIRYICGLTLTAILILQFL